MNHSFFIYIDHLIMSLIYFQGKKKKKKPQYDVYRMLIRADKTKLWPGLRRLQSHTAPSHQQEINVKIFWATSFAKMTLGSETWNLLPRLFSLPWCNLTRLSVSLCKKLFHNMGFIFWENVCSKSEEHSLLACTHMLSQKLSS